MKNRIEETDLIAKDSISGDVYYVTHVDSQVIKGYRVGNSEKIEEVLRGLFYKVNVVAGEYNTMIRGDIAPILIE